MTVLSDKDIKECLGNQVIISPFDERNVNTSSYDVTLGEFYYIEKKPGLGRRIFNPVFNIWDFNDVRRVWSGPFKAMPLHCWHRRYPWRVRRQYPGIRHYDNVILLPPRHTILAHTHEFIGARYDATTMMKARSSYGRNFIEVCKCAGWGDVGYVNRWTMEITNNSRFYHLPLVVGRRIAQIAFLFTGQVEGAYPNSGKYQESDHIEVVKYRWKPEMLLPRIDKDRENPNK